MADAAIGVAVIAMMRMLSRPLVVSLLLLACPAVFAQASQPVPKLTARVTDLTGTLTVTQQAVLEQKLTAFEERKGSQVAVLIVPTTEPEEIAQYSIRVVDEWKLGRAKVNNTRVDDGALLLVAKNDRRMRIEVGRGLEGVLTDATSKRIIAETITPLFRQGDFFAGINAGLDQIIRVIDGEPLPPPDHRWRGGPQQIGKLGNALPFLIFAVFIGSIVLRRIFGRGGGAIATGGATGVLAFLFSHVVPIALFAGGIAFLFSLLAGASGSGWSSRGRGGGFGGGLGGGGFGGFGGGFGGGGGGGGGGFGGGGGGFGGGGASGGW